MKPKIWDSIIFGTEADLDALECRLYELDPVVHRFVIAESRINHQGRPKPLWLRDNWERFAPWHDRIIHIEADLSDVPGPPDVGVTYWELEVSHRDALAPGLAGMDPDDWLIHGDTDEIPRADAIQPGYVYRAQHHAYALEWECRDGWRSMVCVRAADAPAKMRDVRNLMGVLPMLAEDDEGRLPSWHLSWFGGLDACDKKFDSFCHGDIPRNIRGEVAAGRFVRDGWHWQGHYRKLHPYRGDDFPRWVRDGREPAVWHRSAQLDLLRTSGVAASV